MASIKVIERGKNSLSVQIIGATSSSSLRSVSWWYKESSASSFIRYSDQSTIYAGSTISTYVEILGLSEGTSYDITAYISEDIGYVTPVTALTLHQSFSITSITPGVTSVVLSINEVRYGQSVRIVIRNAATEATVYNETKYAYGVSNGTYTTTISGLSPDTGYYANVNVNDIGFPNTPLYFETLSQKIKPERWYWNSAEIEAFANKGNFSVLTQSRWEDYIASLNSTIEYCNATKGTNLSTVDKSHLGHTTMKATAFNQVRQKLDALCNAVGTMTTGISTQYPDNKIYGWYFTTLSDCLYYAWKEL